MDTGYIKLYRQLVDNPMLAHDHKAFIVFIWLLLKVNRKTGTKIIGRQWAAKEVGLTESSFYRAVQRLEQKWHVITLKSNNKYTEVLIVNWIKFQSSEDKVNNKRTTSEQPANTLQDNSIDISTPPKEGVDIRIDGKRASAGGLVAPTTPTFPKETVGFEPLERWAHKGETVAEQKDRKAWERASKDTGMSMEELKKRII